MNKKEKIELHKNMVDDIIEKETEIAEEIAKTIISYYNDEQVSDFNQLYQDILDLMYISLKQTYKITISQGAEIYSALEKEKEKIEKKKISNKEINSYTYSKDNLTLAKRVKQYIDDAKKENIDRDVLIFYETRILDNETLVVHHKLLKEKLKKNGVEIAMLIPGGGCSKDCCNDYFNEWVHIDDIEDEPPYHPNCKCEIIYDEEKIEPEKEK